MLLDSLVFWHLHRPETLESLIINRFAMETDLLRAYERSTVRLFLNPFAHLRHHVRAFSGKKNVMIQKNSLGNELNPSESIWIHLNPHPITQLLPVPPFFQRRPKEVRRSSWSSCNPAGRHLDRPVDGTAWSMTCHYPGESNIDLDWDTDIGWGIDIDIYIYRWCRCGCRCRYIYLLIEIDRQTDRQIDT